MDDVLVPFTLQLILALILVKKVTIVLEDAEIWDGGLLNMETIEISIRIDFVLSKR